MEIQVVQMSVCVSSEINQLGSTHDNRGYLVEQGVFDQVDEWRQEIRRDQREQGVECMVACDISTC